MFIQVSAMLEIHKQYVVDENGTAIAVQISIDEFKQIESLLENSQSLDRSEISEELDGEAESYYVADKLDFIHFLNPLNTNGDSMSGFL
jgi:hypothetical protein